MFWSFGAKWVIRRIIFHLIMNYVKTRATSRIRKKKKFKSDIKFEYFILSVIKSKVVGSLTSYLLNLLSGSASLMMFSKSSTRWHMHASAAITQSPSASHWYFRQNCVEKYYKNFNSVKWCILLYTLIDTKNTFKIFSTLVLLKTTSPVELIVKSFW